MPLPGLGGLTPAPPGPRPTPVGYLTPEREASKN